jgi:putative phosphoribosyl transferase
MTVSSSSGSSGFLTEETVRIPAGPAVLEGKLELPLAAGGLVVMVAVTGSPRIASNDIFTARRFHASGLGSLFVDLLMREEEPQVPLRYDVGLLADRLKCVSAWVRSTEPASRLGQGYYGAASGAAAALRACAESSPAVGAIVCRGGRPDLAADALPFVQAPTLLLVGERDEVALEVNRRALDRLRTEKRLLAIPNAGPFFDEPGALEEATRLAASWFEVFLSESA